MTNKNIETWVWVLIYGGMLLGILGLFVYRSDSVAGSALGIVGGMAVLAGLLLIYWRSRRGP